MQEEVENRSVTLCVSGVKLTGRVLKAALSKYLQHKKEKKQEKSRVGPVKPEGKQTVKQLIGQNQGVANIEISDKNIKSFDRVARKYGVDYAVKKDKSGDIPKYLVFFKARDADALTAAFTGIHLHRDKAEGKTVCYSKAQNHQASGTGAAPAKVKHKDKGWSYRKR